MMDSESSQNEEINSINQPVETQYLQASPSNPNGKSEEKEEKITNYFFGALIILTFSGTFVMIQRVANFRQEMIERNPGYNFPKVSDLYFSIIMTIIMLVIKVAFEMLVYPIAERITAKKYKNPEDKELYALGRVYMKKTATNIYKLFFYFFMVIFGYRILSQLDYFPTSLGGSGYIMRMFETSFPEFFYHWKPDYFDIYYLTSLGYCMTDLIWLIFIYELQSDFVMMLLHHVCTISLISFSYLTNWSNIGCIVLFLHDLGDVFVYWTRIIINTDIKSIFTIFSAVILLIVFIYTRIYVFGEAILSIVKGISWDYYCGDICLTLFLCFLYIMHINWVYLILKKILKAMFENKCEDTASVKKVSKTN